MTIGNKAIKVHSNTCRIDADVVPLAIHRWYYSKDTYAYLEGVCIKASTRMIYNWPQQNYDNNCSKNSTTYKRYKGFVRILKNIRKEMQFEGYSSSYNVASYLLECLAWNVPDYYFDNSSYLCMTIDCLNYLKERLGTYDNVKDWLEVNKIKYLFRPSQPWSQSEAYNFIVAAESYLRSKS